MGLSVWKAAVISVFRPKVNRLEPRAASYPSQTQEDAHHAAAVPPGERLRRHPFRGNTVGVCLLAYQRGRTACARRERSTCEAGRYSKRWLASATKGCASMPMEHSLSTTGVRMPQGSPMSRRVSFTRSVMSTTLAPKPGTPSSTAWSSS